MQKPSARLVVVLVLVAATARLIAAATFGDQLLFTDERDYVDAVASLRAGEGFGIGYARVPAYPLVLVAFDAIVPFGVTGLRVAQALVTAGGTVLVVALGSRIFGPGAGLVAGAIYALDPLLVVAASLLYPEALAALVFLLVVLAAGRAVDREDRLAAAASGVLLGIAAQLRPVALVLIPVVAAWIAVSARRRSYRSASALVGALVAACLVTLTPWTLRNYRVHGGVTPIATAGTQQAPVEKDDVQKHGLTVALASHASQNPAGFLTRFAREIGHFFEPYPTRLETDRPGERVRQHAEDSRLPADQRFAPGLRDAVSALSYGAEMTLAITGMIVAWRERRSGALLLAAMVAAYALGFGFFMGRLRYRIPIMPLLFVFAGAGTFLLWRTLSRTVRRTS